MLGRLRTYFLTGIIVAAPIAITIWLVWWFVSLIDGWIKPFIPSVYNPDNYLPFPVPGVGLVVALFVITVIGALAANLVGKTLINFGERTLDRMPVVRSVYKGVKQIFETAEIVQLLERIARRDEAAFASGHQRHRVVERVVRHHRRHLCAGRSGIEGWFGSDGADR